MYKKLQVKDISKHLFYNWMPAPLSTNDSLYIFAILIGQRTKASDYTAKNYNTVTQRKEKEYIRKCMLMILFLCETLIGGLK